MTPPFVSVVIPVRNGQDYVVSCLEALTNQTYPRERYEIIVVDGMSTDATRILVEEWGEKCASEAPLVRIGENPKKNRGPAMNVGIRAARGTIIMRVDIRNIVPVRYISDCIETLFRSDAENIGGMIVPHWHTSLQRSIGIAMSHPCGVGNALFRIGKSGYTDTVYLGCYRKDLFDRIGFFDEVSPLISEETDMNYRIRKSGGKLYSNADIHIGYYPRERMRDLAALFHRYGGARAMLVLRHRSFSSLRQILPLVYVVLVLVLAGVSIWHPVAHIALLVTIAAYLLFIITGGLHAALRHTNIVSAPLIALCFCIMHISWALGFFRTFVMNGILQRNANIEA